jgi:hypothetical protein
VFDVSIFLPRLFSSLLFVIVTGAITVDVAAAAFDVAGASFKTARRA